MTVPTRVLFAGSISAALLAVALVAGCRSASPAADHTPAAGDQPSGPPVGINAAPLQNVFRIDDRVISGSMPEDDAGFDALARLGVRSIISVDGATPDVERAHARKMRYVHIPVGYDGIHEEQQLALARAIRDLPGVVYVHCHHGKHRGPTAAAVAQVLLGRYAPEDAIAFMHAAGTSESYPGLFACVQKAHRRDRAVIDNECAEWPEVAERGTLVESMAKMQDAFDNLERMSADGWKAAANHPDQTPASEIGRLEGLLRPLTTDPALADRPAQFHTWMRLAHQRSTELESAIRIGVAPDRLAERLSALKSSCRDCHARYRDFKW